MKPSLHCGFTPKIVVVLLAFAPVFAPARADQKETNSAARQAALKVSSKKLESPKTAMEPPVTIIKQVEAADVDQQVQVRVMGSGDLSCLPFRLDNPDRLVLDCSSAHVQVQQTPLRVDLDPVRSVRLGQFKTDVARVVIELAGQVPYTIHADGKNLTVVFDAVHPKPSVSISSSKEGEASARPLKGERDPSASTNTFPLPDNLVLPRYSESSAPSLIHAQELPQDRLLSPWPARPQPSAVANPIRDVQEIAADPGTPPEMPEPPLPDQDYVIGPQDVLAINVWHEAELSQSVPVRPDGKISLPLIGDLEVSGLTPRLLQARLTKELSAYIRKPQVTVIVREINSHKFYILGEVERPGAYTLTTSMTVLNALAAAGGFRDFAKVSRIYVLRLMPDNSRKKIHFDFKAAVNGKDIWYRDFELQPGDTLVVP
jgi:polysaccharide biosynthesis/export protein